MLNKYKSGLFLVALFFICVRLLSSCTVCYECKPKGASEDSPGMEVCPRDGEESTEFDIRVNHIRAEGYTCK